MRIDRSGEFRTGEWYADGVDVSRFTRPDPGQFPSVVFVRVGDVVGGMPQSDVSSVFQGVFERSGDFFERCRFVGVSVGPVRAVGDAERPVRVNVRRDSQQRGRNVGVQQVIGEDRTSVVVSVEFQTERSGEG